MSNYYLQSVILQNCPYGNATSELLDKHPNIKQKSIIVNNNNKENYKTDQISTFPQIYLKKKNKSGSLLIGGYSDLKELFDLFHNKTYSNDKIKQFMDAGMVNIYVCSYDKVAKVI